MTRQRKQEFKSNKHMETREPQDIPKQGLQPQDQNKATELTSTKHNDIWTAHERPAKTPNGEMEVYMCKQIRTTTNPNWKTEAWYPETTQLYQALQQSPMQSWLGETQITTILPQTQDNQMIHPRNCEEMLIPRIKLQQQWKKRNHDILEQMHIRKQETKEQRHHPHAKKTTQTELIQYIAAHPEMPEETELNRDDRQQLAELMLEYPPKKRSQELAQQEETPPEQKRKYTCIDCNRPFSTTIRKFNHIRRYPECQNSTQQEIFGNKCNDCSRTCKAPINLKEHQKCVCADLRGT